MDMRVCVAVSRERSVAIRVGVQGCVGMSAWVNVVVCW